MKAIITTSANPFHYGHLSLYNEGIRIFGRNNVKVAIGKNVSKNVDFNRIAYHLTPYKIKYDIAENITLADYCKSNNVNFIIRGIRNSVDAEYELKLDFINKEINKKIQTMFFPTKEIFSNISSTYINEFLKYNKYDVVKKYMNEDAMYRFVNKYPTFIVFFGKSCVGKTYFLNDVFKNKNIINVDDIFWDIFEECYGKEEKNKIKDESKSLIYGDESLENLIEKYSNREFWETFFAFIEKHFKKSNIAENCADLFDINIENDVYLLDFAHIGNYWNTIPADIKGKLYLVNVSNSKENRNCYINKKGFEKKIFYLDKNYREPSYCDKVINIDKYRKE